MAENHADRADAYLYGLLSSAEALEFERQAANDGELGAALELAKRRRTMLESALPPAEASELLVRVTLNRIDERTTRVRRWRRRIYFALLTPLVAGVLMIALFHTHYSNLQASPANLEVFGQNTLIPGSRGSLRVRLTDRTNQKPLSGVPVEVTLGEPGTSQFASLATFATDERGNGSPAFTLPEWADGNYTLRVTASTPQSPEVITQSIRLKRSAKLLLTCDKPVYQPGQTIHLRSLTLMKPDLKPAADATATFVIRDPRGNMIFSSSQKTSRFGIAATNCPLADELIEGAYRIEARVGDTDSSLSVDVRKYVLPKIRVTMSTERTWYQPGSEVRGLIQANYQHGEPVANSDWTLEVTSPSSGSNVVARLNGRTSAKGEADYTLRLPANANGSFALNVQVRDQAGQEQSRRVERPIDRQPFRLTVIPESGLLVRGMSNTLYIQAFAPDGNPVRTKGAVVFNGVSIPAETNELGIGSITIKPTDAMVTFSLEFVDAARYRQNQLVTLQTGTFADDFLVRLDRAVYLSGETMRLRVEGGDGSAFVDLLKDDQTVRSDALDIRSGIGELDLDIPADLFGTLQLCVYRFDSLGRSVKKTRTIFVRPSRQLRLDFKPDRTEYRPGAKGNLSFTLTDERGQGMPGAISIAMVDEAVFDVRQQLPGLERTFYLLEQKLLHPAGTANSWAPDAQANPDENRLLFERAWFSRTAQVTYPTSVANSNARYVVSAPSGASPQPHSIMAETYSSKKQEFDRRSERGVRRANVAWVLLALAAFIVADALLWMNLRLITNLILHGAAGFFLACILFAIVVASVFTVSFRSMKSAGEAAPTMAAGNKSDAAFGPRSTPSAPNEAAGNSPTIRVRDRFPETMLWEPQLITDDHGRVTIPVEFADSITTWRLSASAVSTDGRLGALQTGVRVFQPFFVDLDLPVALTRNDEFSLSAVVSNFAANAQSVELKLEDADWFEQIGPMVGKLDLQPNEVRSVSFRIRAKKVGQHELRVTAKSAEVADSVSRRIEVLSDGRRIQQITNGTLSQPTSVKLELPTDAIEGSGKAILRVYPSSLSHVVDGLDGIFRLPTGCFEQTSSSLYPNVMALSYLRKTNRDAPSIRAKAEQFIHSGYQRLLKFEVPGGGFEWYGRDPANVTLSAYGLMQLQDMAQVHSVDPNLIERTRQWLLRKRGSDGSWDDPMRSNRSDTDEGRIRTTAFVAWAVFGGNAADAQSTLQYLLRSPPESIRSPYVLALVCNALLAIDSAHPSIAAYVDRLVGMKNSSDDGRSIWWELNGGSTVFYGAGRCGNVETTALAALAITKSARSPDVVAPIMTWIAEQRQVSHWGSTQATILALKALLQTAAKPLDGPRRIELFLNDAPIQTLVIPPEQAEVMQQIDLSSRLKAGKHELRLLQQSGDGPGFQLEFRYHLPPSASRPPESPLGIDVTYDRLKLAPGQKLAATATATNRSPQSSAMVMVEMPIPPGFRVETEAFDRLVSARTIDRYEISPTLVTLYLRSLAPNRPLTLSFAMIAGHPCTLSVPPAKIWEYYNPDRMGTGSRIKLEVTP